MNKKSIAVKRVPTPKERVEALMPAVLWTLSHEYLREQGYAVREDMDILVTRAMREAVEGVHEPLRTFIVDRASEEAAKILRAANADNAQRLWVALAHAMLGAANRGVVFAENILLIATAVETELAEFDAEFGGLKHIQTLATRMDNVAWSDGWWKAPHEKLIANA